MNLGKISRDYSYALMDPYKNQSKAARDILGEWHNATCTRLKINVDAKTIKRQGVEGLLMSIPAIFNSNLHYKAIPNRFAGRIRNQSETPEATDSAKDDLFHEDTQFIIKDGTIYYLPQ